MGRLIKAMMLGASGFLTVLMLHMVWAPPNAAEAAVLGPAPDRIVMVQMRLARAMMTVAPDYAVARFAAATGAPEAVVRAGLNTIANGPTAVAEAESVPELGQPQVRTDAGSAKFVRSP